MKKDKTISIIHKHIFVLAILIFASTCYAVNNGSIKNPDPKKLIGQRIQGTAYPDGWRQIGSDGFGRSSYSFVTLQNGKTYALTIEKKLNEPKLGERIEAMVIDAILVDNPTSYFKFSRLCYYVGEESKKTESNIIANVGFARYCDRTTRNIKKAWRINLDTGKFDPIENKEKLTCEYGFVSLGEWDFRDNCYK